MFRRGFCNLYTFLISAHEICWHILCSILRSLRLVRALVEGSSNISLSQKATAAFLFALAAWGSVYELSSSAISQEFDREAIARHIAEYHAAHPWLDRSHKFSHNSSGLHTTSEESSPAVTGPLANLPDQPVIAVRYVAMGRAVPRNLIRPPLPDHLIEFSGTPPPSHV